MPDGQPGGVRWRFCQWAERDDGSPLPDDDSAYGVPRIRGSESLIIKTEALDDVYAHPQSSRRDHH